MSQVTTVEIIAVGDEVTSGAVTDTNSAFIAETLAESGFEIVRHTAVRDEAEEIADAVSAAVVRADAVIVGGGLGPTADDVTATAAASAAGVRLVRDAATLDRLRRRFERAGLQVTPNNERQADVPEGCEVIGNRFGTAPAFRIDILGRPAFFLPGVPRELRPLVEREVVPRLVERFRPAARLLRVYKFVGIAESHLDARVADLPERFPSCRFAFRTLFPENHLRVRIDAPGDAERASIRAALDIAVRERIGDSMFGVDGDTLVGVLHASLTRRAETLAVAESCTGGLLGALWTDVPGASRVFKGGIVAYANEAKERLLGVDGALIAREGAVSEVVARAMAEGARRALGATNALAISGVAGPDGGTPEKPVGTLCVALAHDGGVTSARRLFPGDRAQVRRLGAFMALDLLWRHLKEDGNA